MTAVIGALAADAPAQGGAPAKGSREHIAAVTKRVDGAFIAANAAKTPDWPSHGLNPDTGKYVWHYQETPGDNWDYTSTQPIILADLKIGNRSPR